MIDFGFDKIALIGAVALIVIGPEKLPRVARTVGHFIGKAQRYVADVKAEVNRSIELEELKKMKTEFEDAARGVERDLSTEMRRHEAELNAAWNEATGVEPAAIGAADAGVSPLAPPLSVPAAPAYRPPRKNWRLKRGALPQWYRKRHGIRGKAQSAAARVARFRPPRAPG
jgi:sec-independent protein translocase protein TatB